MASDLTAQILDLLSSTDDPILSSDAFPAAPSIALKSALDRLRSRDMIIYETIEQEQAVLLPEAEGIVANGSHEAKVFEAVRAALDGLKIKDLPDIVGKEAAKVGAGNAFKKGWIKKIRMF
ncbi:phenylalanyl-tRNA synthetase alpha chain [Blastomyces dermatitidis ATCC 26199]|nr:phenylalanyl-tRNA synthetase alpha chain [Blastomyces dermatitidis ATCC 26199]